MRLVASATAAQVIQPEFQDKLRLQCSIQVFRLEYYFKQNNLKNVWGGIKKIAGFKVTNRQPVDTYPTPQNPYFLHI